MKWIILLLLSVLLIPTAAAQDMLAGTEWRLESLDGQPVVDGTTVTLNFGPDGQANGSGGCNGYSGSYQLSGDTLSFGQIASTLMACAEPILAQESAFFAAMGSVSGYTLDGDQLTITYGDNQALVLLRVPGLAGTGWQLIALAGEAVSENITLSFGADGRLSGNGGCNSYSGPYTTAAGALTIGPLLSTRIACPDSSENAYFAALQAATSYTADGSTLTIYTDMDEMLIFAQLPALEGVVWNLELINGSPVVAPVTLEFDADASSAGGRACNSYGGSYVLAGDTISFSGLFSTMMACTDDGVMEQEQAYFDALSSATRYAISGDTLTITYGDGQTLVFTASQPVITVTVTYRERMALPPDAVISAQLQDVSRADVAAVVLAEASLTADGANVPFTLELAYDPAQIVAGNRYIVRAEIRQGDDLLFTTDQSYPVLTDDSPSAVEIILVRVS